MHSKSQKKEIRGNLTLSLYLLHTLTGWLAGWLTRQTRVVDSNLLGCGNLRTLLLPPFFLFDSLPLSLYYNL